MKKETPRIAVPEFRSRVAPVLNWCSRIHIYSEEVLERPSGPYPGQEILVIEMNAFDCLRLLWEKGVRTVICGALSPDLLYYGERIGLTIIHGVAGEVTDVLKAYHDRTLDQPCFRLPGCRGPRRYGEAWANGCPADGAEGKVDSVSPPDGGMGRSRAEGARRGATKGRPEGVTSGPGGLCLCPRCGAKREHKRGIPCTQASCPHCGVPMVRE